MSNVRKLSWFKMRNVAAGVASLDIFGQIGGYGVNFPMFARQLDELGLGAGDKLKIRINSDGGDVYQGFAIYQALALHPATKEITVMGLAASMASVIFMAGDTRVMPANATLMIHNPVGQIVGESDEIIAFGEGVGEMKSNIAAAYADASGGKLTLKQAVALMDRQSWVGAKDALKYGLATEVMPSVKIAAKFDLSRFPNAPKNIGAMFNRKDTIMPKSRNRQEFDFEGDAAETRAEVRTALLAQHKEITALCTLAGKPALAAEFIEDDMTLSDVVAELDTLAQADKAKAAKNGKNGGNVTAGRDGKSVRETRRENRTARNARDGRAARGEDGGDEISARNEIDTSANDGGSGVPELNAVKIWDKWNKAGTATAH